MGQVAAIRSSQAVAVAVSLVAAGVFAYGAIHELADAKPYKLRDEPFTAFAIGGLLVATTVALVLVRWLWEEKGVFALLLGTAAFLAVAWIVPALCIYQAQAMSPYGWGSGDLSLQACIDAWRRFGTAMLRFERWPLAALAVLALAERRLGRTA